VEWQTQCVDTNGIQLHVYRGGVRNSVPVVLLHGITDNGLCWERVAVILADTYDVIMIDARGHGQSDKPRTGYTYAHHAADVAGVIDALGLATPVVIGHSMGAATAAAVAQRYPDKVRALVLEDPPWRGGPWPEGDQDQMLEDWKTWLTTCKTSLIDDLVAQKRSESPLWAEADMPAWAQSKREVDLAVFQVMDQPPALTEYDLAAAVTCPALLVTGDVERRSIVPPDLAARIAELPGFEIAHIAGAGHNIRQDQFAAYIAVVSAFLKRVLVG
jgi:N-formylmaleamate deformylase